MGNNNQHNIKFTFTGDAGQLRKELDSLKRSLGELSSTKPITMLGKTSVSELSIATEAASKLKIALEQATNVNTGKLNLTSFINQLQKSGLSLEEYRINLSRLGPEGQAAFQQLTNSIITAENHLFQGSALLEKLKKSLANVFQWNISSSIFNFITGQIREAFNYAQDLNKALTDISIVSGKNANSMREFAKEANTAAKALNTSTKAYTQASLIYFQQGLSDAEVKERTDITIKMANVTGEAASDVSSYMTAIWNNFDDGSESLEHYADVITALGAATASSSEEIAGGLEKFAAIADTVGLSYEYATAALATVVSITRQSEETVGTAFKTIFGRMQSLSLGEALEDGVDLTKYSSALQTVGIEILGANNELKDMDLILDELGQKWGMLSDAEKTALANTLAGTRQYANFIALMDNYKEFEINLKIAEDAEGTLDEQADIYGKSWEAATNRVKASAESLYDSLIDSDSMIAIMDFISSLISKAETLVKSMGGVQGVLTTIGMWLMKIKHTEITQGISRAGTLLTGLVKPMRAIALQREAVVQNIASYGTSITGNMSEAREEIDKVSTQQYYSTLRGRMSRRRETHKGTWSQEKENQAFGSTEKLDTGYKRLSHLQSQMVLNANRMSESEKAQAQAIINRQIQLEKELKIKEIGLTTAEAEYNTIVKQAELKREEHEKELIRIKEEAEAKRREQEAERIYNEKVRKMEEDYARARLYDTEDGLHAQSKKYLSAEAMGKEAKLGSKLIGTYDNKNTNDRTQLSSYLNSIVENDNNVNYLDAHSFEALDTARIKLDSDEDLTEEELIEIREILDDLKVDAKTIVAETKREIETMITDAGGDVVAGTSRQAIRNMAEEGETQAINRTIKAETGVQNVGSGYNSNMYNADGSINANVSARLQRESVEEANKTPEAQTFDQEIEKTKTNNQKNKQARTVKRQEIKEKKEQIKLEQQLRREIDALNKVENKNEKTKQRLEKLMKKYNKLIKGTEQKTDNLEQEFKESTIQANKLEQELEDLIKDYATLGASSEDIDLELEGMDKVAEAREEFEGMEDVTTTLGEDGVESLEALSKNTVSASEKIALVGESVMGLASLFQSVKGSFQIFTDKDTSLMDKIIAGMSLLSTIIPVASTLYKTLSTSVDKATRSSQKKQVEDGKEALSTGSNTTAQLMNSMARQSNPIAIAGFVAALVIGIVAIAAATSAETAELEANTEQLREQSEAAQESISVDSERIATLKEEIKAVNESAEAYRNKKGAIEEYYQAALGMSETLKDKFGEDAAVYVGDLEYFSQHAEEITEQLNKKYAQSVHDSALKMQNDLATITKNAGYSMNTTLQSSKNDSGADDVENILKTTNKDGTNKYKYVKATADGIKIDFDDSKSDQVIAAYKEMEELKRAMENAGEQGSESYAQISAWLSDNKEKYQEVTEAAKEYATVQTESIFLSADIEAGEYDKNIKGYLAERENMLAEAERRGISEEDMISYLSSNEATAAIESKAQNLLRIAQAMGKEVSDVVEEYNNMSLDEQKAFLLVNVQDVLDQQEAGYDSKLEHHELQARMEKTARLMAEATVNSLSYSEEAINSYISTLYDGAKGIDDLSNAQLKALSTTLTFNKALADNGDQWIDNYEAMIAAKKGSIEYYEAIKGLTNTVENIFGLEEGSLSIDWASQDENAALMQRFLSGDTTVLKDIQISIATNLLANTELSTDLQNNVLQELEILKGKELDLGQVISANGLLDNLNTAIKNGLDTETVEQMLSTQGFTVGWKLDATGNNVIDTITKSIDETQLDNAVIEIEIDRTTKYIRTLERLEKQLDDLSEKKNAAFGTNKIRLIEQEAQAIEKLSQVQSDYIDELEASRQSAQTALSNSLGNLGVDLQIDANTGEILNRDEILEASGGSESIEALIEDYEDVVDSIADAKEEQEDFIQQLKDSAWEKFEYQIELRTSLSNLQLAQLENDLAKLEGKVYGIGESFALLDQQMTFVNADSTARIQEVNEALGQYGLALEDISKMTSTPEGLQALQNLNIDDKTMNMVKELPQLLNNNLNQVKEAKAQAEEMFIGEIERLTEEFTNVTVKFDTVQGTIDSYNNIVGLVGKNLLGNDSIQYMQKIGKASIDNMKNQFLSYQENIDILSRNMAEAEARRADAIKKGDDDSVEYWQEQIKTIEMQLDEASANMMSSWEGALQAAADLFATQISSAIETMENAIAGGFGNLSYMQTAYNQQSEINEQYLSDYEQMYELSKLTRNINNSINQTTNIKARKELQALQDEIANIQEHNIELSEHDLSILQQKYDLRLAEIALEDAQNTKTQVRMQRDAEGNLGFVYTANQTAIDQAQQAYEDKLYAMQQSNAEYLKQIESQMLSSSSDIMSQMETIANDTTLTIEEKEARLLELEEYAQTKFGYLSQEYNKTLDENKRIYQEDLSIIQSYTKTKLKEQEDFVTDFNQSVLGQITGAGSMEDFASNVTGAMGTAVTSIRSSMQEYSNTMAEIMESAGITGENGFAQKLNEEISGENGLIANSNKAFEQVTEQGEELVTTYNTLGESVTSFQDNYLTAMSNIESETSKVTDSVFALLSALTGDTVASLKVKYGVTTESDITTGDNTEMGTNTSTGSGADTTDIASATEKQTEKVIQYQEKVIKALGVIAGNTALLEVLTNSKPTPQEFASGGYTGTWGNSGKLAVLHEKEMVLNSQDTANILATVDMARQIIDSINTVNPLLNLQDIISQGFGGIFANGAGQPIQQEVTITAEFPNVSNHSEIEQAFENLVNMASQYAKR